MGTPLLKAITSYNKNFGLTSNWQNGVVGRAEGLQSKGPEFESACRLSPAKNILSVHSLYIYPSYIIFSLS